MQIYFPLIIRFAKICRPSVNEREIYVGSNWEEFLHIELSTFVKYDFTTCKNQFFHLHCTYIRVSLNTDKKFRLLSLLFFRTQF